MKNVLGYFHHGIGKNGHRRQKRRKNIATAKEAKRKKNKEMNEISFVVITRDTGRNQPADRPEADSELTSQLADKADKREKDDYNAQRNRCKCVYVGLFVCVCVLCVCGQGGGSRGRYRLP